MQGPSFPTARFGTLPTRYRPKRLPCVKGAFGLCHFGRNKKHTRLPAGCVRIQLTFFHHDLGNLQTGVAAVGEIDGPEAGVDQQVVAVVVLQQLGVGA